MRPQRAELAMEPFLDLMAVLIMSLVATAAWGEMSAISVDENFGTPPLSCGTVPPLAVHITASHIWAGRSLEFDCPTDPERPPGTWWTCTWDRAPDGSLRMEGLVDALAHDDRRYDGASALLLVTDDGVAYGDMMAVLDLVESHGYEVLLGGGPP
jgi:biopolymer transport protein ExbD